jgi:hypothetical protein
MLYIIYMATAKKGSSVSAKTLAPKNTNKKKGKAHKSVGPKATPESKYRGQGR